MESGWNRGRAAWPARHSISLCARLDAVRLRCLLRCGFLSSTVERGRCFGVRAHRRQAARCAWMIKVFWREEENPAAAADERRRWRRRVIGERWSKRPRKGHPGRPGGHRDRE